jgi:hypothetical protein
MEELIEWVRAYPGQTGKSLVIAKATELLQKEQTRMYSEEEVLEIIRQYALEEHLITSSKPDIWFKQYKKK